MTLCTSFYLFIGLLLFLLIVSSNLSKHMDILINSLMYAYTTLLTFKIHKKYRGQDRGILMLTLFLWDCWITFESLIWEQSFTFLQFKPYYNVHFNFFGSLSIIFFFCNLKNFLTLSFYWNTDLLSSMSSMTLGYFAIRFAGSNWQFRMAWFSFCLSPTLY